MNEYLLAADRRAWRVLFLLCLFEPQLLQREWNAVVVRSEVCEEIGVSIWVPRRHT